jgi:hypothetical protein
MRAVALLLVIGVPLAAQWDDVPIKIPRLPNGKPNLAAPAPRAANGKPDLSGTWLYASPVVEGDITTPLDPNTQPFLNLAGELPKDAVVMRPAAAALFEQRSAAMGKDHPLAKCLPVGEPGSYAIPAPTKIVQTPDLIVMLHEEVNSFRQIFLDGRKLPKDPVPTWIGYSIGRWDGDTLVVESSGFNDKTWLDGFGHPHTEALRLTERIRRTNAGHLDIQITINDPGSYEKPWTASVGLELLPTEEPLEKVCLENEKDLTHLFGQ